MSYDLLDQRVPQVPRPPVPFTRIAVRTIVVAVQIEFGVGHVGDISCIPEV